MKTVVVLFVLGATCGMALEAVLEVDTAVNATVWIGGPHWFFVPQKLRTPTAWVRLYRLSTFASPHLQPQPHMCLLADMDDGPCQSAERTASQRGYTELSFANHPTARFLYIATELMSFRYMVVLCDGECHNTDLASFECTLACSGHGVCDQRVCHCDGQYTGQWCESDDEGSWPEVHHPLFALAVWAFIGLGALVALVCCVCGLGMLCCRVCCRNNKRTGTVTRYAPLPPPPAYAIALPMPPPPAPLRQGGVPPPYSVSAAAAPQPAYDPLPQLVPIHHLPPPVAPVPVPVPVPVPEPVKPTVAPRN